MRRPYFIFSAGRLRRKDNTLSFEPASSVVVQRGEGLPEDDVVLDATTVEDEEECESRKTPPRLVPIETVDSLHLMGEVSLNTRTLNFLSKERIPAHYFNYYGHYSGTFYPRDYLLSGFLLMKQADFARDNAKRIALARAFIEGAAFNILKNLRYYENRGGGLRETITSIERLIESIPICVEIPVLMGVEGNIRKLYYEAFPFILTESFGFVTREKRPPDNPVNALISFGNSLVYTACISELYRTQLSPVISFLHEPGERRFSLALDLAEVFKPFLADRVIFKVLNQRMIQRKHFEAELNGCYLTVEGRKIFTREFESRLETTIMHRQLKRKVSYRRLIRLECYKLVKHLLGDAEYEAFKVWW